MLVGEWRGGEAVEEGVGFISTELQGEAARAVTVVFIIRSVGVIDVEVKVRRSVDNDLGSEAKEQ